MDAHLALFEKRTGRKVVVEPPKFPSELSRIWEAFCALDRTRDTGKPINYQEMLAWSKLTKNKLSPRDVETITKLDNTYLRVLNE